MNNLVITKNTGDISFLNDLSIPSDQFLGSVFVSVLEGRDKGNVELSFSFPHAESELSSYIERDRIDLFSSEPLLFGFSHDSFLWGAVPRWLVLTLPFSQDKFFFSSCETFSEVTAEIGSFFIQHLRKLGLSSCFLPVDLSFWKSWYSYLSFFFSWEEKPPSSRECLNVFLQEWLHMDLENLVLCFPNEDDFLLAVNETRRFSGEVCGKIFVR